MSVAGVGVGSVTDNKRHPQLWQRTGTPPEVRRFGNVLPQTSQSRTREILIMCSARIRGGSVRPHMIRYRT